MEVSSGIVYTYILENRDAALLARGQLRYSVGRSFTRHSILQTLIGISY